jgi:phosphoenolpyruvate synthase/pyruvate phosphate dikinase
VREKPWKPKVTYAISLPRITDAEDAGGKGANLGELVAAELPVPGGFVLMRSGYLDSIASGRCRGRTGRAPRRGAGTRCRQQAARRTLPPDAAARRTVAAAEQRLLLESARRHSTV